VLLIFVFTGAIMGDSQSSSLFLKPSLIIIGNGMATGRLLDEIIKRDANKYQITVIGNEPYGSYNRIMLSSVLAGDTTISGIIQKDHQWYKDNHIKLISHTAVTNINSGDKVITLDNDKQLPYQELILAVGSRTATIPAENQNIQGIFNFRNIEDTQKIEAFAKQYRLNEKKAIVIGGGLLGLEAAYGLAISGVNVTLIHRNKWLLNRQLDKVSGKMLEKIMAAKNINFVLGYEVTRFESTIDQHDEASICGATLTNGDFIEADIAVIATGITPNKELATSAEIEVNRAIIVDDYMQTSNLNISALGECCEHRSATFGLVDPIWKHCETLAERLINNNYTAFNNVPVPTKLKVSGVQLFSAGVVESSKDTHTYTITDENSSIYRKIIVKNDVIVGVVLFGDVSSGMTYFDLMKNQHNITNSMPELLISDEFLISESAVESACDAA
jgi:nitrite reductase (NADH) large subunit